MLHRRVEWRDLDAVGHVNNATYADYVEDVARQAAANYGWSAAAMEEKGFDLATREMCIDYRLPALPSDGMEIATWLSEVTPDAAVRHTTIARVSDGELLAQARTSWGCVDVSTREAMAAPEAFLDDLMPNMALDT